MFFNTPVFKKLLKEAYQGPRLTVGLRDGTLMLEGRNWIVWLEKDRIPNKGKAAIVEYSGDLPEEDGYCRHQKELSPQYELPGNASWNWNREFTYRELLCETGITLNRGKGRTALYQREQGDLVAVDRRFPELIDVREVDHLHQEGNPAGPFYEKGGLFVWKSKFCVYATCGLTLAQESDQELLTCLSGIDFQQREG